MADRICPTCNLPPIRDCAFANCKREFASPPVAVQEAKRLIEALPFDEFEITSYPARPTGGMQVGMPSGVTITHKPSKLAVSCDSERSQHRNRDKALQMMALVLAMKGDQP